MEKTKSKTDNLAFDISFPMSTVTLFILGIYGFDSVLKGIFSTIALLVSAVSLVDITKFMIKRAHKS